MITVYAPPPIPVRNFDWCAWLDCYGEKGPFGYGTTEVEAILELEEMLLDAPHTTPQPGSERR